MVFDYEDEETYGYDDESEAQPNDPVWDNLDSGEKKTLMKNVFTNRDWYQGEPFHEGGTANPDFATVSDRSGAPIRTIKKYYAAWLNRKGLEPSNAFASTSSHRESEAPTPYLGGSNLRSTIHQPPPARASPTDSAMDNMMENAMQQQVANTGSSDAMGMMFMMKFLGEQQSLAMQQSQFQMMQMLEQRRLDQQREGDMRREQLARDQAFMNQQMTLMKDTMKRGGDDGFFDNEVKSMFKERMVDNLLGGDKDESWRDTIKEVVGSDTLKTAVAGLGTALGARNTSQIPAGYDNPEYNPYAQGQLLQQEVPPPTQPPVGDYNPSVQAVQPTDGVFFSEEAPTPEAVAPPVQPEIPQYSEDDYKQMLFSSITETMKAMGTPTEDPKVIQALQQQVEVAVQTTMMEMPDALPQLKIQRMSDKLLIVRNIRDIGMGLMQLRERTEPGQPVSPLVMSGIVNQLRSSPDFYKIFATNSYDELMAKIDPFKDTGAVAQDYSYLLQPDVQEICRSLLYAVAQDAQTQGLPTQ